MGACACGIYMCRGQKTVCGSQFSLQCTYWEANSVIRLGGKYLYPLTHLLFGTLTLKTLFKSHVKPYHNDLFSHQEAEYWTVY